MMRPRIAAAAAVLLAAIVLVALVDRLFREVA